MMKKFLLMAFAVLFVGAANAQVAKKQPATKPQVKHEIMQKATVQKSYSVVPAKDAKIALDKTIKAAKLTESEKSSLKPVTKNFASGKRKNVMTNLNMIEKPHAMKINGMRKAEGTADASIEGTWTFYLGDYYFQTSTLSTLQVEFEATLLDGGLVTFEDPTGNELPFVAEFNEGTNTLTFSPMYTYQVSLQNGTVYQLYQNPFVYNYTAQALDHQAITATYNPEQGEIKFAADNGIAWEAHSDTNGTFAGYFGIYDLEGASRDGSGGGGSEGGDVTVQAVYEGYGTQVNAGAVQWNMYLGTAADGTLLVQDVIPSPFDNGVVVEYTRSGNNIIIAPQIVASGASTQSPTGELYVFLESATTADGTITLTLDNEGNITGTYSILYGAYTTATRNDDDYLGYYGSFVQNIKYNVPGNIVTPTVSFETGNLVLFAGLGLNGYSFLSNLALTGAYATTNFANLTTDATTGWNWTATVNEEDVVTGTDQNFGIYLAGNDMASNVTLVGINQTAESAPFTFGVGKYLEDNGQPHYTDNYIYSGGYEGQFMLNGETPAIMTRQDPDGDLTFYTNWATPDKATNSMSKIYLYHEKPATPLYIEGITLPLVNFTYQPNFNLHIKIVKADYSTSKIALGEVIAEADANLNSINDAYDMGLTGIEFTELYKESEDGLSEGIDYLFLDSEFVIVIEGWDNGTFTGVLGSQDAPLDNARSSVWFEKSDEEGSMYSYTSWKTSLFVGFLGAAYGYLNTEDNTNVAFEPAGGQATIHVNPMFSNAEGSEEMTRLWLDDSSDDPEWITIDFANEVYSEDDFSFDLVIKADELPAGAESRTANLVFVQEGAKLVVTVTQTEGASTSINSTVVNNGEKNVYYNLQGVRVANPQQKGIYILNNKKVVVK